MTRCTRADDLCVWQPTEAGAKLKPGAWMNGPKLPGFPKPTAPPKARRDANAPAYAARLGAAIKVDDAYRGTIDKHIGSGSDGWRLVHTDGHRAVLLRGEAEPGKTFPAKVLGHWPTQAIALEPEVCTILQRMRAAGNAKRPAVRIELKATSDTAGRLTFSTTDIDDGTTAREWIPVTGVHLRRADITVDPRYLLDALGLWPAVLRLGGADEPIWICTEEMRHCLMPMREDAKGRKPYRIASETWATDPSTGDGQAPVVATDAAAIAAPTPAPVAAPPRPTAVPRAKSPRPTVTPSPAVDAPTGLTAGQKAAATRAARIAAGVLTIDYSAAARKAVATRQARQAA